MKPQATTAPYNRTTGSAPRGYGMWAFQRSTKRTAFGTERYGDVESFSGTYVEARRQAQSAMSDAPFVAVLG